MQMTVADISSLPSRMYFAGLKSEYVCMGHCFKPSQLPGAYLAAAQQLHEMTGQNIIFRAHQRGGPRASPAALHVWAKRYQTKGSQCPSAATQGRPANSKFRGCPAAWRQTPRSLRSHPPSSTQSAVAVRHTVNQDAHGLAWSP